MSALPQKQWTPEEYLAFERASDEKHEFVAGEIFNMSGASFAHNMILANVARKLGNQLEGRNCAVLHNDMRVRVRWRDYVYPDVVVVCGDPQLAQEDNLLNPTLIIEVLSPSTEQYDKSIKFDLYRSIESVQEYVLIAQDRPHITHYIRQPNQTWLFSEQNALTGSLELPSINCVLAIEEIYAKVTFDPPTNELPPSENPS